MIDIEFDFKTTFKSRKSSSTYINELVKVIDKKLGLHNTKLIDTETFNSKRKLLYVLLSILTNIVEWATREKQNFYQTMLVPNFQLFDTKSKFKASLEEP